MPVAKSYQSLKTLSTPYTENGKTYINVLTKSNTPKKVRWYTDQEYIKLYPEDFKSKSISPLKEVLGFGPEGYITIFYGDVEPARYWFLSQPTNFNRWFGWHLPEGLTYDASTLPPNIQTAKLYWKDISTDDYTLKPEETIRAVLKTLKNEVPSSSFQGSIGDKIKREVTVVANIPLTTYYGPSHLHIFRDSLGNEYIWKTQTKNWLVGEFHSIVGTVKSHEEYNGTPQTHLTRVKENSI